jgi:SAM-dependent methyltransferase
MNINWVVDANGIYRNEKNTEISYPDVGNDSAFSVEDTSPWFNQRNELIIEVAKRNKLSGNFLDIGGGNGFQAKALLDNKVVNDVFIVEPGYKGCQNAKKRGVDNIYCGVFQDFEFETHKIQICGLFDVIEHIEDDIKFLNELYERLLPNSHVIVNVPSLHWLWSDTDVHSGHFRRYSKKDLTRIAQQTKFQIIDNGYYFSYYTLPLLLLRVIPFRFGFRKNLEEVLESETQNHQNNKGLMQKYIQARHNYWIKKIKQGKSPRFGTSLFFILHKK